MNQEERAVIDGIFERLKGVANQPRDPEAERHIAQLVQAQPYAPYAMAQSVFVQEQALLNQQQQIEQLQAQVQQLQQQAQAAPQQSGGFLSGLFGGGAAAQPQREAPAYGQRNAAPSPWGAPAQPQQAPAPQAGPWGQPAQPQAQGGGSSFLKTAAGAAAGVAGGMVLGNILSSAFGGGQAHAAQGAGNFGNLGLNNPQQNNDLTSRDGHPGAQASGNDEDYDDSDDAGYDDGGDDSYEA